MESKNKFIAIASLVALAAVVAGVLIFAPQAVRAGQLKYENFKLIVVCTVVGLAFAAGFVLMAVWAIRAGQFKDVEGVKYRMLEDFNPRAVKKDADGFKN
jgi:cbb3-type cytochrome oxidase maturation protein